MDLLKMANPKSYPMKNPYTPGKKILSQGQNELSTEEEHKDPSRAVLRLWPGSSFSYPTTLTGTPAMSEGGVTAPSSLQVCDKLETTGTFLASGSKSTFTSTQRQFLSSSATWVPTNPVPSTSQGHQHISVGSDSSSFNWLPNNENASEFSSKFTLNSSDDSCPSVDQPVAADLNPHLAVTILMNYGLGEDDLDELLSYPEDQTTAENLPNTLHEIRMKKTMRASASLESYPAFSSQPISGMGKIGRLDETPKSSLRPSKVVDPGHSGKCFSEVEDKIDQTICQTAKSDKNMLLIDGFKSSSHSKEEPQKRLTEVKSSSSVSSDDEMSNIVATPSSNPTKLQTSPNQTLQKITTILSSSNKYKDMSEPMPEVLKYVPSKEPVHQVQSKTVQASRPGQGVNSGHSVVQMDSKDDSCVKSQTKTQQVSNMTELENQQIQQKMVQKPSVLEIWQALQPVLPFTVKPVPKLSSFPTPAVASHPILPPVLISNDPGPSIIHPSQPVGDLVSSTNMSCSRQLYAAKTPTFKGLPPLAMMHDFAAVPPRTFSHTCSLCMEECEQMKDWMFHQNTNLHLENCKRFREQYPEWDGELPIFPSALSRSAKTSSPTSAHTSQHHQKPGLESRSRSRSHSPHSSHSSRNRQRKSRSSSSSSTSSSHQHRSRDRRVKSCSSSSRSYSHSPRRRSSRGGRVKSCSSRSQSCSLSPRRRSSRDIRVKSCSSSSRSCSRSPRRHNSRNRRDKSGSNSRSYSPRRHFESQKGKYGPRSPRRAIYRIRSRSTSRERQASPKRKYRKLQQPETLKPKRNYERRSPTSCKQQPLSRRDEENHPQPKKSDEDSASFKESRKRRVSLEESSCDKKNLSSIKKLTDRLLENPVVQSLSEKSDIKDIVEQMVPFVLAELANKKASSSLPSTSSSVTSQDKKRNASTPSSSAGGSSPSSSSSSKSSKKHLKIQKSEKSSSLKSKTVAYDKPSPPTIVKLKGVFDSLSHNDVVAAVKQFGKTKSVLLLKSKQATVCFEKEKYAENLRSVKSIDVKGVTLTVVAKRGSIPKSVSPDSTEDQIEQTKQKSAVFSESSSPATSLPAKPKSKTSVKKKEKRKSLGYQRKRCGCKKSSERPQRGRWMF